MSDEREKAAVGARILQRLVPAPDKGPGFRRDPETSFVYYASEWLGELANLNSSEVEAHELKAVK